MLDCTDEISTQGATPMCFRGIQTKPPHSRPASKGHKERKMGDGGRRRHARDGLHTMFIDGGAFCS